MSTTEPSLSTTGVFSLPGWLVSLFQVILIAGLPLVLVLLNARVLMSNAFIRWEYNRPNFPADPYGFTTQDRLQHAPVALAYLFNDDGIDFLGRETFPDGSPLYNERELSHMEDVKNVTHSLSTFGYVLIGTAALAVLLLAASPPARPALYRGLFGGSMLTVVLIIVGLIAVATSFNWLFTQFHRLFFEGNSWLFLYSDTLIRLFPIQFWTDAFALMFGGALAEAVIIGAVMQLLLRR